MTKVQHAGFTLAELLISLAILGVIAIFAIPKILTAQQSNAYNAAGKEAAAMIAGAYQRAQMAGIISSSTTSADLTPYMNYVSVDTSTPIDDWQTGTTWGCTGAVRCLTLHNGGKLAYDTSNFAFRSGSTTQDNALLFQFDPDGRVTDGTTNGPGKALAIVLYYNGGLGTEGTARPGSYYATTYPGANYDPPWFSW